MKVARTQIAAAVADMSANTSLSKLSKMVAAYLLDQQRSDELDSLMRDVMELRAEDGIVEVTAISAHEISDQVKKDIETQVRELYPAAKAVIINSKIDQAIVGGIKLEFANQQLDLSVKSKLNRMRQYITYGKDV